MLFFIDGANFIDDEDEKWEVIFAVQPTPAGSLLVRNCDSKWRSVTYSILPPDMSYVVASASMLQGGHSIPCKSVYVISTGVENEPTSWLMFKNVQLFAFAHAFSTHATQIRL